MTYKIIILAQMILEKSSKMSLVGLHCGPVADFIHPYILLISLEIFLFSCSTHADN